MLIAIIVIGIIIIWQLKSIRYWTTYSRDAFYEIGALRTEIKEMQESLKYSLMRIDDNTQ